MRFSQKEREYAFAVAMKYLKDEDEASDVAQDALLNAYRHRHTFRGDSQFSTWLYRVAATTALMHLRKKRRMPKEFLPREEDDRPAMDSALEIPSNAPTPEDEILARQAVFRAEERLAEMGEKYGDVFFMRFRDGYSETEIAKRLRLNVATVKTRAYRARAAIRAELMADGL
ncbi:MAG: sigma-70 family RNA polymerase sigma factor [Deltaproteobacteria bacterium]|nr:sigma-70 family RNA polymerase sigma factor [Deltaproteobacteria bacterium]